MKLAAGDPTPDRLRRPVRQGVRTALPGASKDSIPPAAVRRCANLRTASRIFALVGGLVGALVLGAGWALGVSMLRSILPGAASMKANTAVGLMLTAAAILFSGHRTKKVRRLAVVSAALLTLLSLSTILEYVRGWNLGIDEILFADRTPPVLVTAPGRMAVTTAITFLFLSAAILLRAGARRLQWAQLLAAGAVVLCLANLIGYLYGIGNFAGIAFYTGMAVHTSSSLLILSLAILFADPDRALMEPVTSENLGGILARRLLPAAVVVPVFLGWLRWQGELKGLYGTAFGVAVFATANVVVFVLLTWTAGWRLNWIDAQKAQATALLQSRDELLSIFVKRVPAAVAMFDRNMRFLQVSDRWCADHKVESWEVLGRSHYEVFPNDSERWRTRYERCLAGETLREDEDHWERPGGESTWLRWEVRPWGGRNGLPEGILIFTEDITRRKQEELELRKFVSLADNSGEFIGMCDMSLMPFYANHAALALVGLDSLEQAFRTPVPEFFFPEDQRFIVEEFFPTVVREGRGEVEIRFRHFKTGEPLWMIYNVFHIKDSEGKPVGLATVSRDIDERKQAETALRNSEQELRSLARRLITAQEDERRRIAQDLHDEVTQQLAVLSIEIGTAAAEADRSTKTRERCRALQSQVTRIAEEVRRVSHGLHPSVIEDFGLSSALEELCQEVGTHYGIDIAFDGLVEEIRLSENTSANLYRIAQEALHNTVKHAQATEAWVTLSVSDGRLQLTVTDDGVGFVMAPESRTGLGVASMKERMRMVGGSLSINTLPGQGTTVIASVPIAEAES